MTELQMFEMSFERPRNYFNLSSTEQWEIDNALGILDWEQKDLTFEEVKRFKEYYDEYKEL